MAKPIGQNTEKQFVCVLVGGRRRGGGKTKSMLGLSSLILRTGQADNSLGAMQGCPDFQISFTLMLEFWDKTIKYFED